LKQRYWSNSMANLYPASIANRHDVPDSEKQVFEKLKLLDDTYHVFHSLTWHDGRDGGLQLSDFIYS